jgi:hypothetical protein
VIPLKKEFNWLSSHPKERIKYAGEYIAVVGTRIVAHGKDPVIVIEKAKKYSPDPFLAKAPRRGAMIV